MNAAFLVLASWIVIFSLSFQARPGAEVIAAVFPPLWNSQQIFSAVASSDATIVRVTAWTAVMIVRPSEHEGLARLRHAGAWLIVDPQAVAACIANIKGKYRS